MATKKKAAPAKAQPKPKPKPNEIVVKAEKRMADADMNKRIPVTGEYWMSKRYGQGVEPKTKMSKKELASPDGILKYAGKYKKEDLMRATGVRIRGSQPPRFTIPVKGKSKSGVEVGRKQRAASGKKTTRKMK